MSVVEGKDVGRSGDVAVLLVRRQFSYWLTPNKQKVAERLCRFLKICKKFDRTQIRAFLWREKYGTYPYPKETGFVRKALSIVLTELTYSGYVVSTDNYYVVVSVPSLAEAERILLMQLIDYWR
jgi:hypothetical protein